jgi:hypothetical protein
VGQRWQFCKPYPIGAAFEQKCGRACYFSKRYRGRGKAARVGVRGWVRWDRRDGRWCALMQAKQRVAKSRRSQTSVSLPLAPHGARLALLNTREATILASQQPRILEGERNISFRWYGRGYMMLLSRLLSYIEASDRVC